MKSLKPRNQTLAPPFPELRYLSLAYNKVTFCFSACFLRGTEGRVGHLKASPPIPCATDLGAQEFSGWGEWRPRQESIHSVTDIYLAHVPGSAGHWVYSRAKKDWAFSLMGLVA